MKVYIWHVIIDNTPGTILVIASTPGDARRLAQKEADKYQTGKLPAKPSKTHYIENFVYSWIE